MGYNYTTGDKFMYRGKCDFFSDSKWRPGWHGHVDTFNHPRWSRDDSNQP